MAKRTNKIALIVAATIGTVAISSPEAQSQGRGGRGGGGGGGRSGGHSAPNIQRPASHASPAVTRPANSAPMRGNIGAGNVGAGNIGAGNVQRPNTAGNTRPNIGTQGITKPDGGFQRPNVGNINTPSIPNKPNIANTLPGKVDPPKLGGNLPGTSGKPNLPNVAGRPNNPPSSSQLNDFLGMGNRPNGGDLKPGAGRPDLGKVDLGKPGNGNDRLPSLNNVDRTNIGKNDSTKIGNRIGDTNNINVGNVNIGNSIDFSKDQKAWIDNRHVTGDQVRINAGNRYAGAYVNGAYRHGVIGGYPYYNGWHTHGAFYGWRPVGYVALGTFLGASWANTQPVYYAYGTGGNVYYENNVVYVDGQASGTPAEYAAQSTSLVAAAPEQTDETEWLPLGAFAFTQEGVDDSQAMIELAVSKEGVLAGTYYNEATQISRSLKGTIDKTTQRAAFGFADGKNTNLVVETGVQNLTQDEAPALLHNGADQSTPVLLVRLQPPADSVSN